MTAVNNDNSKVVTVLLNEDNLRHYYRILKNMRESSCVVINPLLKIKIYLDEECLIESEVIK